MSNVNSTITGTGQFQDTAANYGTIYNGEFSDTATNTGSVQNVANFTGQASNEGTVNIGNFSDSAVNDGLVSAGSFTGTSTNTGSVSSAVFDGQSSNSGTVITQAIFAGTSTNTGNVIGDAQFEDGAINEGTVTGNITEYISWTLDSATPRHLGELFGGATLSDEGGGVKAANFNGSSRVVYNHPTDFNFGSGDFTIEMFVNPSSNYSSDQGALITTADPTDSEGLFLGNNIVSGEHRFSDYLGNGSWQYAYGEVNGTPSNNFPTYTIDAWQHIAWVRSGNTFTLYKNGVSVKSYTANVTLTNTNNLISVGGRTVASAYFTGKIAGLRVVKGSAIYTSNFSVPTSLPTVVSGTKLLLNFGATAVPTVNVNAKNGAYSDGYFTNDSIDTSYNNGTPTQAQDDNNWYTYASGSSTAASGAYSNGYYTAGEIDTNNNSTAQAQDDNAWYTYTAGVPGPWYADSSSYARNIINSGSTLYDEGGGVRGAELSSSKSIDTNTSGQFTGDFTVEYFIKLDGLYGFPIGNIRSGGSANDWALGHPTDGSVYLSSTVQGHGQFGAGSVSVGNWSHIALTRTNGTVELYVNGIKKHTYTSTPAFTDYADIIINPAIWAGYHVDGKIAMVRVSSVARYSSNTYTIPSTVFNSDADTLLLLNFGATAAPTVNVPNWYDNTSSSPTAVTLNGTVTQSDQGNGVKVAVLGSNGYLTTTLNDDLGTGDFTIEAFIDNNSYNSNTYLIDARSGSNWAIGWGLDGTNDGALSFYDGNAITFIKSNTAVAYSRWSHLAVVRNSNSILIYLNGINVSTAPNSTNFNGTGTLTIGRRYEDLNNSYFNGSIAGLRIVKGTAIYTANFAVPSSLLTNVSGTKLLLNFGATTVPTISNWYNDTSPAARSVTLNGTVTQSNEGGGVVAAEFNSGYFTIEAPSLSPISGDLTLEMFVKPTDNSTYRSIVTLGNYNTGILLRNSSNGAVDNLYFAGSASSHYISNNNYLTQNAWNHVAIVRSSSEVKVYVNGLSIVTFASSTGLDAALISIGNAVHSLTEILQGKIAALRLVVGFALYSGDSLTIPTTLPTAVNGTQLLMNFGATNVPNPFAAVDAAALAANLTAFGDGSIGRYGYYYVNGSLGNFTYAEITFIDGLAYVSGSLFTGSGSWNGQTFVNGRATTPFVGQSLSITSNAGNYYRHDGNGNTIQVWLMADNDNVNYYFNSSTYGIGSVVYTGDGNLYALSTGLMFGDLQYSFSNMDGVVTSIIDTDPYN